MTDPTPAPATPTPEAGKPATGPRWIKVALAISVALNLAVAGLATGAWLRDGPGRGLPREMSFGPFTEALSTADRKEIRKELGERASGFRQERERARAELETLLEALRASPFDPAAMQAALSAISSRATDRLELGRSLIEARLLKMSDADRLAFADRLERGLKRH